MSVIINGKRVKEVRCSTCGKIFYSNRSDAMFCCKSCRLRYYKSQNTTKSEYCIDCKESYQNQNTCRWHCRRTGKIVVGTDGRATINAMKCH